MCTLMHVRIDQRQTLKTMAAAEGLTMVAMLDRLLGTHKPLKQSKTPKPPTPDSDLAELCVAILKRLSTS